MNQHLVLGLLVAAVWLAGSIILITKIRTKPQKAGMYVITVVLFILCAGIFAGIQIGLPIVKNIINEKIAYVDDSLKSNYGNNPLVRTGVNVSNAPQAITELEGLFSQIITSQFGLSNTIIETFVRSGMSSVFVRARNHTDLIASYANESGRITSSSILNMLESELWKIIENIAFWITIVLAAILAVFLLIRVIQALKKPKE